MHSDALRQSHNGEDGRVGRLRSDSMTLVSVKGILMDRKCGNVSVTGMTDGHSEIYFGA